MNTENRKAPASGASVKSGNGQPGDRTTGGLPDVRGDNSSSGNDVRRSQLPGMQRSDSVEHFSELQKGTNSMEEEQSVLEREIEKINAYQKLAKKFFAISGVSDEIEEEVNGEFHAWVQTRIEELLGKKAPAEGAQSSFTEEEVVMLKAMAMQVRSKMNAPKPQAPINPPANKPAPSALKEAINTTQYNKQQMEVLDAVRKLEAMHNTGPEF